MKLTLLWAAGFWQGCQILHWDKNGLFKNVPGQLDILDEAGRMKDEAQSLSTSQHTKINSKWTRDLNVKAKIIQLWQENIGVDFHNLGLSNSLIMKAKATKEKSRYMKLKIENFGASKETHKKVNPQNERKYLQILHLIRDCYPEYIKKRLQLKSKKLTPFKNGLQPWTDIRQSRHANSQRAQEKMLNVSGL